MKNTSKKMSLADIKARAGKTLLDAEAIKGGRMESCHVQVPQAYIHKTDNA